MADNDSGQGNGNGNMRSPADLLLSGASPFLRGLANVSATTILAGLAVWLVIGLVGEGRRSSNDTLAELKAHAAATAAIQGAVTQLLANEESHWNSTLVVLRASCVNQAKNDEQRNRCEGLIR